MKEYINRVDDHMAEFVGSNFCHARLAGFIEEQRERGMIDDHRAAALLEDLNHMARLVKVGKRYVALARNPAPEIRIMVLADEERERCR